MTHYYRWRKYRPDLFYGHCRIIARGMMNSVMVEFLDGTRHVVSRFAVRKLTVRMMKTN